MVRWMGEAARGYSQIKYGAISLGYIKDYPTWDEIREYCHLHFIYHVHETKTALPLSIMGILVAIHGRQDRITSDHMKKVPRKDIGYISLEIVNSLGMGLVLEIPMNLPLGSQLFTISTMQMFILNTRYFPSGYILVFPISSLNQLKPSYFYIKQRDHCHTQDRAHIVSFLLDIHNVRPRKVPAEPV